MMVAYSMNARGEAGGLRSRPPVARPRLLNVQSSIPHFSFGFILRHFQASNVVDFSITPLQNPAFDDFPDIS